MVIFILSMQMQFTCTFNTQSKPCLCISFQVFLVTRHYEFLIVFRLPEWGGCHWRDQYLHHRPGSDFPLGRLWDKAAHPQGGPTSWFGEVQNFHQGWFIWPGYTPTKHLACECSLLPGH